MVLGLILSLLPTYGNATRLAAFLVGMVLPTFESLKAIESKRVDDDTQWLMYWVCYSTLISLETVAWSFLSWLPFYRVQRILVLGWLALPQFRGAAFLYREFVRPFLLVAVDKARELPALEPYVRDFMGSKQTTSKAPSAATSAAPEAHPPAAPPAANLNFEELKREAVQKVEETFDKAKQQASSADEEERLAFQPLKAHAQ